MLADVRIVGQGLGIAVTRLDGFEQRKTRHRRGPIGLGGVGVVFERPGGSRLRECGIYVGVGRPDSPNQIEIHLPPIGPLNRYRGRGVLDEISVVVRAPLEPEVEGRGLPRKQAVVIPDESQWVLPGGGVIGNLFEQSPGAGVDRIATGAASRLLGWVSGGLPRIGYPRCLQCNVVKKGFSAAPEVHRYGCSRKGNTGRSKCSAGGWQGQGGQQCPGPTHAGIHFKGPSG